MYTPLINYMERHWFVALRVGDHVIKVRTGTHLGQVRRGDWIAYRLGVTGPRRDHEDTGLLGMLERLAGGPWQGHQGPVWVRGGCTFGRVLAVAGDEVTFRSNAVLVAGESFPLRPYMPTSGTIRVEQGSWFIWPEMAISGGHGNVAPEVIQQTMMQLANVPEENSVGMAYQRWLWRKQTLP